MKEFFIKGKQAEPGMTVTDERRTFVVTNQYHLNLVDYGNHAEHHVSVKELNRLLMQDRFNKLAEAIVRLANVISKE